MKNFTEQLKENATKPLTTTYKGVAYNSQAFAYECVPEWQWIADRIKSEYYKYEEGDWIQFSAIKINDTFELKMKKEIWRLKMKFLFYYLSFIVGVAIILLVI